MKIMEESVEVNGPLGWGEGSFDGEVERPVGRGDEVTPSPEALDKLWFYVDFT